MAKYIAAHLLTAFLSTSALAASDDPHLDAVRASFDRMLDHQPAAVAHAIASEGDALQQAFAAHLWSGGLPYLQEPLANASAHTETRQRADGTTRVAPAR